MSHSSLKDRFNKLRVYNMLGDEEDINEWDFHIDYRINTSVPTWKMKC